VIELSWPQTLAAPESAAIFPIAASANDAPPVRRTPPAGNKPAPIERKHEPPPASLDVDEEPAPATGSSAQILVLGLLVVGGILLTIGLITLVNLKRQAESTPIAQNGRAAAARVATAPQERIEVPTPQEVLKSMPPQQPEERFVVPTPREVLKSIAPQQPEEMETPPPAPIRRKPVEEVEDPDFRPRVPPPSATVKSSPLQETPPPVSAVEVERDHKTIVQYVTTHSTHEPKDLKWKGPWRAVDATDSNKSGKLYRLRYVMRTLNTATSQFEEKPFSEFFFLYQSAVAMRQRVETLDMVTICKVPDAKAAVIAPGASLSPDSR
jgi:hypothetical protein